jgi:hypothetical protein
MAASRPINLRKLIKIGKAQKNLRELIHSLIGLELITPIINMIVEYVAPTNWLLCTENGIIIFDPLTMKLIFDQDTAGYFYPGAHSFGRFRGRRICVICKRTDNTFFIMDSLTKPTIHRVDDDLSNIDQSVVSKKDDVNWLNITKMPEQNVTRTNSIAVSTGQNLFVRTDRPSWICFDLQTETWNLARSGRIPIDFHPQNFVWEGKYSSATAIGPCSFIVMDYINSKWRSHVHPLNCYFYDASACAYGVDGQAPVFGTIDVRHLPQYEMQILTSGTISHNTIIFITFKQKAVLIPITTESKSTFLEFSCLSGSRMSGFGRPVARDLPHIYELQQNPSISVFYFICDSKLMILVDIEMQYGAIIIYQLLLEAWMWEKIGTMTGFVPTRFHQFIEI